MPRFRRLLIAISLVGVAGCSTDDIVTVDVPRDIQEFLVRTGLPTLRGYEQLLADRADNITLFRITYGDLACPTVCSYPRAFGLNYRGRIGWVLPPAVNNSGVFDVMGADAYLMSEDFLDDVKVADAAAYEAVRLWLVRDRDTDAAALEKLALRLFYDGGTPEHGFALLDHATVRTSRQILEIMIILGGYTPAWAEVHNRSWTLLTPFLPPVSQHSFTGSTAIAPADWRYGMVTVGNPTTLKSVLEYVAGACSPTLLLYGAADYAGAPRWDQSRVSRPAPCTPFPQQRTILSNQNSYISTDPSALTEMLGDSLPSGTYYAAVRLRIVQPRDTTFIVRAGPLTLTR
ncbi:MAG: hypothetical protein ACRENP_23675 [Longimicrobiales bacterium]